MTTEKINVIFVVGEPGSGKGTQCKRIAEIYDYVHLSIGDLLRKEINNSNSNLGKEINDKIKNGSLISTEIICNLIENAMKNSNKKNFLLDGFPRNKDNIDGWNKTIDDKVNIQCLLFFDCDEKTSINRCLQRGKNSGRTDDNEETIRKRLITYKESTQPIIKFYEKQNLVKRIDASYDVDKVFEDVENIFKNIILTN